MLSQEKRREITFPTPSICSTSTQWNLWWNDRMGGELEVRLGVHRGWSFATRSTTLLVLPELSCGFSSTTNPVIGKGEDPSNVETPFFPQNNCYVWTYICWFEQGGKFLPVLSVGDESGNRKERSDISATLPQSTSLPHFCCKF